MLPTPSVNHVDYEKVYEPAEDSYLLLDCFEEQKEYLKTHGFHSKLPIVLEVGTGSGIVTTFLHKNILQEALYLTTDLNPHACKSILATSKENGGTRYLDSLQMNLTTGVVPNLVDMLIFNPPYVPAESVPDIPHTENDESWLDLALLGGDDGMIVTDKLLDDLHNILAPNGLAYILFCARNKPDEIVEKMSHKGWSCEVVIHRKAGWEVLSVIRFKHDVNTEQ